MMQRKFLVEAVWDEEARVWVATSDDIPGLVVEADTSEELFQALRDVVPELLRANGVAGGDGPESVPLEVHSNMQVAMN